LIHAGKGNDADGYDVLEEYGIGLPDPLPASAVVAVADLAYVCDSAVTGGRCRCGRWAAAWQYHWRLGRGWGLPKPVPNRCRPPPWYPIPSVRAAVAEQMATAVAR